MQVTAQLVVRLDPRLKERLAKIARRNEATIQSSVNDALTEWANRQEKAKPSPSK